MTGAHLLDELIVSVPDYRESMNDSISILSESLKQNSSQSSSSHCWEEDGSFHSVCIFVLAVSGVCSLATFITVYRVILMIIAAVREPNDINESLRKYKLQPVTNSNGSAEEIELKRLRTVEVEDNVNMIQLVETVTVNVETDPEDTEKDQSCNSQSRDWLC